MILKKLESTTISSFYQPTADFNEQLGRRIRKLLVEGPVKVTDVTPVDVDSVHIKIELIDG